MRCAAVSFIHALAALVALGRLNAFAAATPCRAEPSGIPDVVFEQILDGFKQPTHVAAAFDGSRRLFIVEKPGRIMVVRPNQKPKVFLDIRKRVRSGGEMGLLSVAFHPRYPENGRLFVNFTSGQGGLHTAISEFRVSAKDPDAADPASERLLLRIAQPYSNHNGGQNAFGPDGMLYIGMGDGGSGNDPHDHGQNPRSYLGKMLRVDVDAAKPQPEIYALGLRNPWRFSFDPATGRLFAGDVGQNKLEEIDLIVAGGNYGWRPMEGSQCTPGIRESCDPKRYQPPIFEYGRREGLSVTGGFVYRGAANPRLCGAYVFADYGSGFVWGLRLDRDGKARTRQISDSGLSISSFGVDEDWELYAVDHGSGALYRVQTKASK